jgi:hypothetical protein
MKFKILTVYFAAAVAAFAQQSINFLSPIPAVGTYSNTTDWDTGGGFSFEIGAFASGFNPTASNVGSWASNWTVANQGAPGVTTWIDDDGDIGFSGAGRVISQSAPFTANAPLYIWGYDSKEAGVREWVLLSNTSWMVASDISSSISTDFVVNSSTSAVLGGVSNNGATLQSALVIVSAIPEPAAFAVFVGVGAVGLVGLRRRRRV